jgi:epsilon-lactone hydrolase
MLSRLAFRAFLTWTFFASIAAVLLRRARGRAAHASWSVPYEVAVEIVKRFMANGFAELSAGRPATEDAVPRNPVSASRVTLTKQLVATRLAEVHTPIGAPQDAATFLYWHGGGYVSCSPRTHRDMLSSISYVTRTRVIAPSYPMAPVAPFPAAIDTAIDCYRAVLKSGVPPDRLIVGGDSAGGGLTLAMLLKLREAGDPMPRAMVLLSPWVDLEATGASVQGNAPYDYLTPELLAAGSRWYAGAESLRNPLISPIHADLRGLPPALVLTGGLELFRSENDAFVLKLREAGVPVVHELTEHVVHVNALLSVVSREARAAIRRVGSYVRDQVSAARSEPISTAPSAGDALAASSAINSNP